MVLICCFISIVCFLLISRSYQISNSLFNIFLNLPYQDDGWQMGVRQKDWEEKADFGSSMGVFPENFSKRIQL